VSEQPRDRVENPSINWPQSREEAERAVLLNVRRVLFDPHAADRSALKKTFTEDSGLGTRRTAEQAQWLNDAAHRLGESVASALHEIAVTIVETDTCRHCGRSIVNDPIDGWVDPEAGTDVENGDGMWRETCDAHDTFEARHEPS
jgi:hypothetical protein